MKNNNRIIKKKSDKKALCKIMATGVLLIGMGVVAIIILRDLIANWVWPDINKKIYVAYSLYSEGQRIPVTVNYLTNNGKLFAFCHSLSSVIIATLFLIMGKKVYAIEYAKGIQVDLTKLIKWIEISVLILTIFTFTSKVNSDNNIDKYVIKFNETNYSDPTNDISGDKGKIIGYIKKADLQDENELIGVYESPQIESAPTEADDKIGRINMFLIRNIGRINIYSETLTVILGVYMFVLKGYQKKYLENNKEDNSR